MIKNETKEYLPFKKVDERNLREGTKKVNAVIRHIKTDDVTQNKETCYGSSPMGCKRSRNKAKQERKIAMVEKKK